MQSLEAEAHYLDTEAAARRLSCKARLLQSLRATGAGPKYTRLGRQVRYRLDWLDSWAEANAVTSKTETKGGASGDPPSSLEDA